MMWLLVVLGWGILIWAFRLKREWRVGLPLLVLLGVGGLLLTGHWGVAIKLANYVYGWLVVSVVGELMGIYED